MKKILIFLAVFLFSRENPFKTVIKPKNVIIVKPKFFRRAKVYLDKEARVLKRIVFVYQTVSGDIKNKEVEINKNIDFHSPIIVLHNPKNFSLKEYNFRVFKLYIKNRKIFIKTKDKLIRSFFLLEPFRIVLDFKRDVDFPTIKKSLDSFVRKIVVGAHKGFYRIVIYFDAKYLYKVIRKDEGVLIEIE